MAQLAFILVAIGAIAISINSNMNPYRRYIVLLGLTLPYLACLVYGLFMQTHAFNPILAIFTLTTFSTMSGISGALWLVALVSYFMNFIHLIYAIATMTMKIVGVSRLSERHSSLVTVAFIFQIILLSASSIIAPKGYL